MCLCPKVIHVPKSTDIKVNTVSYWRRRSSNSIINFILLIIILNILFDIKILLFNYSMQVYQDRVQLLLYSHIVALLLARHCILFLSLKYPSWLIENQLMRQLQPKQGFTGLLTNHEAYFWNPLYFISIYTDKTKVDIHNISSLLHYSLIISLVLVEGGELVLAPLSSMSSYATRFACLVLCQVRRFLWDSGHLLLSTGRPHWVSSIILRRVQGPTPPLHKPLLDLYKSYINQDQWTSINSNQPQRTSINNRDPSQKPDD